PNFFARREGANRRAGKNGGWHARFARRKGGNAGPPHLERWRRLNWCRWCNHSCLHQHRDVLRILADTAQPFDWADSAKAVRNSLCPRALSILARNGRASGKHCSVLPSPEAISFGRRSWWPGLHHSRCGGNDTGKGSFRRELCRLSFEQATAPEYRSPIRRGESLVPHSCHGARFPGKQFSVERQALSTDQDRDEFRSRICYECKGQPCLGQLLICYVQRAFASR